MSAASASIGFHCRNFRALDTTNSSCERLDSDDSSVMDDHESRIGSPAPFDGRRTLRRADWPPPLGSSARDLLAGNHLPCAGTLGIRQSIDIRRNDRRIQRARRNPTLRAELVLEEARRARRSVGRLREAASHRFEMADSELAETKRFYAKTQESSAELATVERELQQLADRLMSNERCHIERLAALHEETIARSTEFAASLVRLRVEAEESATHSRAEATSLVQVLRCEQQSLDQERNKAHHLTLSAVETIARSGRRACKELQPRRDLTLACQALESTVEWLAAVDACLSLVTCEHAQELSAATFDCGSVAHHAMLAPEEMLPDACDGVRAAAKRMAAYWRMLARNADAGASVVELESKLLQDLHAARERSSALKSDVLEKRRKVQDLREAISVEERFARAALTEQRWFVPRVASALRRCNA